MYQFRSLQASYELQTSIMQKDKTTSLLRSEYFVEARYVNVEDYYVFTIKRIYAKLESSQSIVDDLMRELGDALFPVELYVDANGVIKKVKNFNEVKERWESVASEIMDRGYSLPTDKYLRLARANFADKERFLDHFSRQTFVQLFFRDAECVYFNYTARNLSRTQTVDLFTCNRTKATNNAIFFEHLDNEVLDCRFEYNFSEVGDVISAEGLVQRKEEEGDVCKRIELKVIAGSRQYKKSNKFVSFLLD